MRLLKHSIARHKCAYARRPDGSALKDVDTSRHLPGYLGEVSVMW
jgi:hypothetical protein